MRQAFGNAGRPLGGGLDKINKARQMYARVIVLLMDQDLKILFVVCGWYLLIRKQGYKDGPTQL